MELNKKDGIYLEVARQIEKYILENNLNENDRLPSEYELEKLFYASRTCIRNALEVLIRKNKIYKIKGRGTYVRSNTYTIKLNNFYSFDVEMEKNDDSITNEIIGFEIIQASTEIARVLNIKYNESVYKIIRLRNVNNVPIMLQEHYLPKKYFHNLSEEKLKSNPLYSVIANDFGVVFNHGKEVIKPILPPKSIQRLLTVDKFLPCLEIVRIATIGDITYEYTKSIIRGDKYYFEIDLTNY